MNRLSYQKNKLGVIPDAYDSYSSLNSNIEAIYQTVKSKTPALISKPFSTALTIVGNPSSELSLGVVYYHKAHDPDIESAIDDQPLYSSHRRASRERQGSLMPIVDDAFSTLGSFGLYLQNML